MTDHEDGRSNRRDSLFLLADVRLSQTGATHRVKVRNLSAGGMMAVVDMAVKPGQNIFVRLRNMPWMEGQIAWVEENRFGVSFSTEIDPAKVRFEIGGGEDRKSSPDPDKLRGPLFRL